MNLYHLSCSEFQLWEISEGSCDRQACCMSLCSSTQPGQQHPQIVPFFFSVSSSSPSSEPPSILLPHFLSNFISLFPYFCYPRDTSKSLNLVPFFPQFFPISPQLQPTMMFSAVFFITFQSIFTIAFISWVSVGPHGTPVLWLRHGLPKRIIPCMELPNCS